MERATGRATDSLGLFGELLGGREDSASEFVVQEYLVVSRIETFLKKPIQSMTRFVLVNPNRYDLCHSKGYSSLSLALLTEWQM